MYDLGEGRQSMRTKTLRIPDELAGAVHDVGLTECIEESRAVRAGHRHVRIEDNPHVVASGRDRHFFAGAFFGQLDA